MATVKLSVNEERLVDFLVAAAANKGTTVRIAGGWVRDKLLGRETKDVDVALDNCSGVDFAERVAALGKERGFKAMRMGVVAANPDQSKHLETATMKVLDLECDFVNLRSETYCEGSRIPMAAFGTAEEDARRRDFTINALFYNAQTREVEDLTGRGLEDMEKGILRTPLEPRVTLLDDPLRALRGVRFHARYGFRLDEDFVAAAASPDVREAFATKVSRERVGKEIEGALKAKPIQAARRVASELRRLNLAAATFRPNTDGAFALAGVATGVDGARVPVEDVYAQTTDDRLSPVWALALRRVVALERRANPDEEKTAPSDVKCVRALAGILSPLKGALSVDAKKRASALPGAVCRDGLKLPARDCDAVDKLVDVSTALVQLADRHATLTDADRPAFRKDLGAVLFDVTDKWRPALDLAYARELCDSASSRWTADDDLIVDAGVEALDKKYDALKDAILGPLQLDNVWSMLKPFFDGRALMSDLEVPKGKVVGKIVAEQRAWQLAHPEGDAEACKAHLLKCLDDPSSLSAPEPRQKKRRHS